MDHKVIEPDYKIESNSAMKPKSKLALISFEDLKAGNFINTETTYAA